MKNAPLLQRWVSVDLFSCWGQSFVRTRDVAIFLGIKQPFEFNRSIKTVLGKSAILRGKVTEQFRDKDFDCSSTTFINVKKILEFYTKYGDCPEVLRHKTLPGTKDRLIKALREAS